MLLSRFGFRPTERFLYEYDFTAGWQIEVRVERVIQAAPREGHRIPVCVAGRQAGPSGGYGGSRVYAERRRDAVGWAMADDVDTVVADLRRVSDSDAAALDDPGERWAFERTVARLKARERFLAAGFSRAAGNSALRQAFAAAPGSPTRRLQSARRIRRSTESSGVPAIGSLSGQEGRPAIARGAVIAMRISRIWSQPGPRRTSHTFPLPCGNQQPHRLTLDRIERRLDIVAALRRMKACDPAHRRVVGFSLWVRTPTTRDGHEGGIQCLSIAITSCGSTISAFCPATPP